MTRIPRTLGSRLASLLAPAVVLAMSAATAAAQSELRPPTIKQESSGPKFMMYIVGVLLIAAVVFAASLKPKRTHQD